MTGEVYQPDTRAYTGLPDIDYSLPDQTDIVSRCGRICLGRKKLLAFNRPDAGTLIDPDRSSVRAGSESESIRCDEEIGILRSSISKGTSSFRPLQNRSGSRTKPE
jgi:hypothetical protein